jgi:hypothetical protein
MRFGELREESRKVDIKRKGNLRHIFINKRT